MPLCQSLLFCCSDLASRKTPSSAGVAYDVNGIIDTPVCSKLALDILITQQTHLWRQVLAVSTE
jgi:hypothetical protein